MISDLLFSPLLLVGLVWLCRTDLPPRFEQSIMYNLLGSLM